MPASDKRAANPWWQVLGIAGVVLLLVSFGAGGRGPLAQLLSLAGFLALGAVGLKELIYIVRAQRALEQRAASWRTLRCGKCDFDLRASPSGRCPECGAENDAVRKTLAEHPRAAQRLQDTRESDG